MRWQWLVAVVAAFVFVSGAPAVAEDSGGGGSSLDDWVISPDEDEVTVGGEEEIPGSGPGGSTGGGAGESTPTNPNVQYRWIEHPTPCRAPMSWYHQERRERVGGSWGPWESTGVQTMCIEPEDAPEDDEAEPTITPQMIRDSATLAAPRPDVSVEPATRTYVNVPTNFSAALGDTTRTVRILGRSVMLTFTPVSTTWAFGDGAGGSGDGIAGAAVGQTGAVEHAYRRGGSVSVTATRAFTVSAQVPGAGTITLDDPIEVTSDPYPLAVAEIQSIVTGVR